MDVEPVNPARPKISGIAIPAHIRVVAGPIVCDPLGKPASHTHPITDVVGLSDTIDGLRRKDLAIEAAVAGKSDKGHRHDISDINNLEIQLNTLNLDGGNF